MFDSVLVANRGEIAVRVIRTLNALGIRSVAVYSDADADAPHVRLADEAVRIGLAAPGESYLSIERVIAAARSAGAQAIHPGYGFLSENPAFARACAGAGIVFVGPSPEAMELLGNKVSAKLAAEAAGVPVLPGLQRPGLTDDEILEFATERGRFPMMVKAAAGGGGRGMRIVATAGELPAALAAARREALAGFGDDGLLVERYVERARHIEVQLLADAHGTVLHLGERECSLQRRHQKVLEESPSPVVSPELRERLGAAAAELARHAGYVGAGTAEFLVPADDLEGFAFLEVNAQLQLDEDAATGFLPATGRIVAYREPCGAGVRVDSGVRLGSEVGASYDSLLLKVIATGRDREAALARLARALRDLRVLGVTTNIGFLARLAAAPEVRAGDLDTGLLERGIVDPLPAAQEVREAAIAAAAVETLDLVRPGASSDPWDSLPGFRVTGNEGVEWRLEPAGGKDVVAVRVFGEAGDARVLIGADELRMSAADAGDGRVRVELDGRARMWDHAVLGADRWVAAGPDAFSHRLAELVVEGAAAGAEGALEAPMPGSVLSVRVAAGDDVRAGEVLVVVESMKMELTLTAPRDARVLEVRVAEGDQVTQGQTLVELEAPTS